MHYRNIESLLQTLLNGEAFRGLDVLEVNATECRSDLLDGLTELVRVFLVDFYIEDINASVYLEQQSLAFHDRLSTHCADVTKTKNGGAVTDYSDKIALICVLVNVVRILLNLQTRIGNAWRISKTEVCLSLVRFCWFYFDFSRTAVVMVCKSGLFRDFHHISFTFFVCSRYSSNGKVTHFYSQ